ncbi:hypothetical protein Tco_0128928 [Tanacetum coccineum]
MKQVSQIGHFSGESGPNVEMTSRDIPPFKIQRLERRKKLPKTWITVDIEGAAKIYNLITELIQRKPVLAGWDDSAFSVFTTNSEEVEGRPLFNRFTKADSMKVVPPPLSGDYTPLSDHIDLDESQMSYGTKSSTSGDSNSVSNDFVSCDNSDKSSEVNTNDFASSDSSVKSSEPKSNDSTSCASTSSVSTSESEAEIESNFEHQS